MDSKAHEGLREHPAPGLVASIQQQDERGASVGGQDVIVSKLGQCQFLLAECKTIQDAKHLSDVAEAARIYARRVGCSVDVVNKAVEFKVRAERRLGELLKTTQKAKGGQPYQKDSTGSAKEPVETLKSLGLTKKVSSRAQQLAGIPVAVFEQKLQEAKSDSKELTTAALLHDHLNALRRQKRSEMIREAAASAKPLNGGLGRFAVICADPPWRYEHPISDSRRIENQYPTMETAEIGALPVQEIATDDAILFLWATAPKLTEALEVMKTWGFTYRTNLVWVKPTIGPGYWVRSRHELLLVGTRGDMPTPLPEKRPDSVFEAPRGEHSEKPEIVVQLIEAMYPELPKIELFARRKREGWEAWGNQLSADGEVA